MSRDFPGGSGATYLGIADGAPFYLASAYSAQCWVYLDAFSIGTSYAFMVHQYPGSGGLPIALIIASGGSEGASGKFAAGHWDGSSWGTAVDTVNLPTGSWQHLAVTWDGTTVIAYRNGVQIGTRTGINPAAPSAGMDYYIGKHWNSGQVIDGRMAEVAIWNVALKPGEIQALAKGVPARLFRPGNLKLYMPILGSGASIEPDYSGQSNHFTVNGSIPIGANPPVSQMVFPSYGLLLARTPVTTDIQTVLLRLQPLVTVEAPVVYFDLQPSGVEQKVPIDAATVLLDLQPTGLDVFSPPCLNFNDGDASLRWSGTDLDQRFSGDASSRFTGYLLVDEC